MFLLAHLAAGYLGARLWNLAAPRRAVSIGLAVFGAILPDLIDKPLSFVPGWGSGRSVAHSLMFLLVLVGLSIRYRPLLPVALGVATHLVLDDPTVYASTLFWPLLGPEFTPGDDMSAEALLHHLERPRTGAAEIIGGAVLALAAGQHAFSSLMARRSPREHGIIRAASVQSRTSDE